MFKKITLPLLLVALVSLAAPLGASASTGHAHAHAAKKHCKKGTKRAKRHGRVVCVRKAPTAPAPALPETAPPDTSGAVLVPPPGNPTPQAPAMRTTGTRAVASGAWQWTFISTWQAPTEPVYGANVYWFYADFVNWTTVQMIRVWYFYGYVNGQLGAHPYHWEWRVT